MKFDKLLNNPVVKKILKLLEDFGMTYASDSLVLGSMREETTVAQPGSEEAPGSSKKWEDENRYITAQGELRQAYYATGTDGTMVQEWINELDDFLANHATPRQAYACRMALARCTTPDERIQWMNEFCAAETMEQKTNKVKAITRSPAVVEWFIKNYIDSWQSWSETLISLDTAQAERARGFLDSLNNGLDRFSFRNNLGRINDSQRRIQILNEVLGHRTIEQRRNAAVARGLLHPRQVRVNRLGEEQLSIVERMLNQISDHGVLGAISHVYNEHITPRADAWSELSALEKWWVGLGFGRLTGDHNFHETKLEQGARKWNLGLFSVIFVWFWISFLLRNPACFVIGVIPSLLWTIPYAGATAWMRKISPKLESIVKSIGAPPAVAVMCFWWMYIISVADPRYPLDVVFVGILGIASFIVFSWRYPWGPSLFSGMAHLSLVLLILATVAYVGGHALFPAILDEKYEQFRAFQSAGMTVKNKCPSEKEDRFADLAKRAKSLQDSRRATDSRKPLALARNNPAVKAKPLSRMSPVRALSLPAETSTAKMPLAISKSGIKNGSASIITMPAGTWVYPDKSGKPNMDLIWKPDRPSRAEKLNKPVVQIKLSETGKIIQARQIRILEGPSSVKGQIAWAVL